MRQFPSRVNAFTWGVKYQRCCMFPIWPWVWEWLAICSLKLVAIFFPPHWLQWVSNQGPNLCVPVIPISKWARAMLYLKYKLPTITICTPSRTTMWGPVSPSGSPVLNNKHQALLPTPEGCSPVAMLLSGSFVVCHCPPLTNVYQMWPWQGV